MRNIAFIFLLIFFLRVEAKSSTQNLVVHHDLKVSLYPSDGRLEVLDQITIPERLSADGSLSFILHSGLRPKSETEGLQISLESDAKAKQKFGKSRGSGESGEAPTEIYKIEGLSGQKTLTLRYGGRISHALEQQGEEYARSFSQTSGIISMQGIYLGGGSYWVPNFGEDELLSFSLETQIPSPWKTLSQGDQTLSKQEGKVQISRWDSPEPQDSIYLIGANFEIYERQAGKVKAQAWLRSPDESLSNRYLEVTAQYLEMYRKLLGPYPYKKFALVENFWETGYGMPSFTLLGSKIIRFPFILHSSYPHEILHNWWGNGVFVDYENGNWCEGLTAYLADHLIQEQRGQGLAYRRAALQGYTNYASESKDFPLTEFRSRHSSATQAVGYGKCLMFFHMLRRKLGDQIFSKALQDFYRSNRFKQASFKDIQDSFEKLSELSLEQEFQQWIHRSGAPMLELGKLRVNDTGSGFQVVGRLKQIQKEAAYALEVPLAIDLEGEKEAYLTHVSMLNKEAEISLSFKKRPLRLRVDPEFDLFRKLDQQEIPPALSLAFGSESVLILLPSQAPSKLRKAYRALAEGWAASQSGDLLIKTDAEIKSLPRNRSVWILGWENRFFKTLIDQVVAYGVRSQDGALVFQGEPYGQGDQSVVLSARHPANMKLALAGIATTNPSAIPGLQRKLPHYGKYSYLAFEGHEPSNIAKGIFSVLDSPTTRSLSELKPASGAALKSRLALAKLPDVFDAGRMMKDLNYLASEELEGRGFGSPGLVHAAIYIAEEFRKAGLNPGGDRYKEFFQEFKASGGTSGASSILKNVLAVLPGSRKEWQGESVILSAHYDHLGLGWPSPHAGDQGKVHFGADDNASGVAILLELARLWGRGWRPERTVILAAFSGEEAGRLGSIHYVNNPGHYPLSKCMAMVNLDTVGRFTPKGLMVLGTGTATEWPHIFRGASWVTGIKAIAVPKDPGASDQVSFIEAGVPAIQLFTGPNTDYHRPTDRPEKINKEGLVKVASIVKEAMEYLASRKEPMHTTMAKKPASTVVRKRPAKARRVSLGTVPDFTFQERGVRLDGVAKDSPAKKANLKEGDIITELNGEKIEDLRAYSKILKTLSPGDEVKITFTRNGKRKSTTLTAAKR
jgi:aminopeptidase N